MRVLLVFPPLTMHRMDVSGAQRGLLMGLAYVAAAVREAGHELKVLNCRTHNLTAADVDKGKPLGPDFSKYGLSDDEILAEIKAFAPEVVGVSCTFTPYFKDAHDVAALVKRYNPETLVVFGGAHTSTFPRIVLEDENVDVAVVGEGERTICELLERFRVRGRDFIGIPGIAHRVNGHFRQEPSRPLIEDLDKLPFPAWDLFEHDIELVKNDNAGNRFLMRKPVGYVLTSRGCPKECYFCSVKLTWSRKWRARGAKNLVDEIEHLTRQYGYREIFFMDDNSSVSRERMHEICDEIIARRLDLRLATPTGIAIQTLDKDLLAKMKKAGFYRLCFGIETGDQEAQGIIKKRIDLAKAKEVIREANRQGFWTSGTFILGFPHDTMKEVESTIRFIKQSGMDFPVIYLLTPQPGTEVYGIMKEQGLVDLDAYMSPHSPDWWKISVTYCNGFRTATLSNDDLQQILSRIYRQVIIHKVFNPMTYLNLLRKLGSMEDLRYLCGLVTMPLNMLVGLLLCRRLSNNSIRGKLGGRALEKIHDIIAPPEGATRSAGGKSEEVS